MLGEASSFRGSTVSPSAPAEIRAHSPIVCLSAVFVERVAQRAFTFLGSPMSFPSTTYGVELDQITIRFGGFTAVNNANLEVKAGEFFTLLGPSGCGKTTLLRAIAGFYRQSEGSISLAGTVIDDIPAHARDTGMVFQNYAVFPHLSVHDNIAYGLNSRKIGAAESEKRIREAIELVDLVGLEDRMPKELSGGQQQRVVIARAVVIRPRVLLMDEPLANLDAKLRVRLRNDLKLLQRKLGITTIYVTHDQEEALSLSDRIAVMSGGKVLQIGTPEEIYTQPATINVAQFIGEGNFLRGSAKKSGSGNTSEVTIPGFGPLVASGSGSEITGEVWVGFRPQDVTLRSESETYNGAVGILRAKTYFGSYVRFEIDLGLDKNVSVQLNAVNLADNVVEGSTVAFHLEPAQVMVFPGEEEVGEL